jgi:hypothetical protein
MRGSAISALTRESVTLADSLRAMRILGFLVIEHRQRQMALRRPLTRLMTRTTSATTSNKWMSPPPTWRVKPRSHRIPRMTKIVQSIFSPSSTYGTVCALNSRNTVQDCSHRMRAARLNLHSTLSDLPHSRQDVLDREVINPQNGHILCDPKPAICGFILPARKDAPSFFSDLRMLSSKLLTFGTWSTTWFVSPSSNCDRSRCSRLCNLAQLLF